MDKILLNANVLWSTLRNKRLVHADGGWCHGAPIDKYGRCSVCGIKPDTQSTELWSEELIDKAERTRRDA